MIRKKKRLMKKTLLIALSLLLCFSISACGGNPSGNSDAGSTGISADTPSEPVVNDGLERGFDLEEVTEDAVIDENPDKPLEVHKASDPIYQNVAAKLDGTYLESDAYLYRNQLSERYKQAYDLIRAGLLEGQAEIPIDIPVYTEDIKAVFLAVYYDSPDLFWVDGGYSYGYNNFNNVTKIVPKYNGLANDINGNTAKMEQAVSQALADMWSLGDPVQQVKYAHDYLTSTINYNKDSSYHQTAYSALVNRQTVCAGYSRAFHYMMQKMGIPCAYIVGTSSNPLGSGGHAWNIVKLGGEFYAMDVTWDDPIGAPPDKFYYDYFNITEKTISADHTRREPSTALPQATGTAKSFQAAFGGSQYGTNFGAINGTLPAGYGVRNGFLR